MDKLLKKLLSILLVVFVILSLAACEGFDLGGGSQEDVDQDKDNQQQEQDNTNYVWSEYIELKDKTVPYTGSNIVLSPTYLKVLPQGYQVVADGKNGYTEIGEYTITYNVVKTSTSEKVYTVSAKLKIEELNVEDYAAKVTLDAASGRLQQAVTVKQYVDGDTTHFFVPESVVEGGVLKARYLAINTPESTGKVEPYGKTAAKFTKSKLEGATSIIIESDDNNWNVDSTGGRYLVWVWYRSNENEAYRNLNIEILQEGLAIASNSAQNSYGDTAMAAINQAKAMKLHVHSGQQDPDFYYGAGINVSLRELVLDPETYDNKTVVFEANIYRDYNNGVYVEEYDDETGYVYGMYLYYGFGIAGGLSEVLKSGNRVHIVGTLQKYEAAGTWQVSGLEYKLMRPTSAESCHVISQGYVPEYREVALGDLNKNVTITRTVSELQMDPELGEEVYVDVEKTITVKYGQIAMNTSVSVKNVDVVSAYTTTNETSSSVGAMSLTCKDAKGDTLVIRTIPLKDAEGKLITQDAYLYKNITVSRGIVDYYNGKYQIEVFNANDIIVNE